MINTTPVSMGTSADHCQIMKSLALSISHGVYVPEKKITNKNLKQNLDYSDIAFRS